VVDERKSLVLAVDATGIGIERRGGVDSAGDGSVEIEFGLHLVSSLDVIVLGDVVVGVLNGPTVLDAGLTDGGRRPGAVSADVDVSAHPGGEVVCDVVHARGVLETVSVGPFVYSSWVSTIAGTTSLAVDNDLGIKSNRGRRTEVGHDLESISNG